MDHFTHKPPSLGLLALEPVRALLDHVSGAMLDTSSLPRGDGHAVIVYPGLGTSGIATAKLRHVLESLGYVAYDWEHGVNRGPQGGFDTWLDVLGVQLARVARLHGKVSLIGWSLGGIYARELAKRFPRLVRQVVTLGTPFAGGADCTNAGQLYELLSGQAPKLSESDFARLRATPPVPTTSIYSRSDGVVAWTACLEEETSGSESIEVEDSSHLGLVGHPGVMAVVADRLSQPDGRWQRFSPLSAVAA